MEFFVWCISLCFGNHLLKVQACYHLSLDDISIWHCQPWPRVASPLACGRCTWCVFIFGTTLCVAAGALRLELATWFYRQSLDVNLFSYYLKYVDSLCGMTNLIFLPLYLHQPSWKAARKKGCNLKCPRYVGKLLYTSNQRVLWVRW